MKGFAAIVILLLAEAVDPTNAFCAPKQQQQQSWVPITTRSADCASLLKRHHHLGSKHYNDSLKLNEKIPTIPSPVVGLGRREWIRGGIATSISSILVGAASSRKANANDDITNNNNNSPLLLQQQQQQQESSWMAPPKLGAALDTLQHEANLAASKVTDQIRRDYHENGVAVVRNVVSSRWIEMLRRGCEDAQDEPGPYAEYLQKPQDEGIFFTDLELSRRLSLFSAFCQYGPCAAVAGAVMGSRSVRYLYDQLFVKEAGVSTRTPWHQDGGYWRIQGQQIGSVFVPLDPVHKTQSLAFVPQSHLWPLHNPQHFADGTPYVGNSLPQMPDIDKMIKQRQVSLQTFDLEPGDVLVFSSRTAHGGPGNWGRALSTRWTGDGATFWARPGEGAIPTGNVGLQDGELLAHNEAAFPTCWTA